MYVRYAAADRLSGTHAARRRGSMDVPAPNNKPRPKPKPKRGFVYAGKPKRVLIQLATSALLDALAELSAYVEDLEKGGGNSNYATASHYDIYRGRLRAVVQELRERGYTGADDGHSSG